MAVPMVKHVVIGAIRYRATRRGLTQRKLEEMTGIKQSSISDIFSGENDNPTLATLDRLAAAVGLSIAAVDEHAKQVTPLCEHCEHPLLVPASFTVSVTYDANGKRSINIKDA